MSKNKKIIILSIDVILLILIFSSMFYILKSCNDNYKTKKESNLLSEIYIQQNNNEEIIEEDTVIAKTERMLKLEELQKQNPDIIGWIEIEGTNINYPVLQGKDNDYYMNHNYEKKQTANGAIFLDKDFSWEPESSNLLIYGHNIKNGTMFQNLLNYINESFYEEHPTIRFTTTKEDANYDIIAVFQSKVYNKTDKNVFRYYSFINAENEEEYNEFVENSKKASLYDTGKTATYGEQLMTLSTCAYHVKDGRFAVVAKKT